MQRIEVERRQDAVAVDRILRSLPEWFGIEEAIQNYVADASRQDSFVAVVDGFTVGVALVKRHFRESAEISLIAVDASQRGHGVGRRLLESVEFELRHDGCHFLQVHTVGPSFEDAAYAGTREFYSRVGFSPLQEFEGIDWSGPTLVMIKSL